MKYKKMITTLPILGMLLLTACTAGESKVEAVIQERILVEEASGSKRETLAEKESDGQKIEVQESDAVITYAGVDVDLTALNSTMVYAEVFNMISFPQDYIGKVVKMKGAFTCYRPSMEGPILYACVIKDATACCAQGIEFVPEGNVTYPDDFPVNGQDVMVTGIFDTYTENDLTVCRVINAVMEKGENDMFTGAEASDSLPGIE